MPNSSYCCLRVDLDYVPWDTPDAKEFGHGEPAVLLRLLDLAAAEGVRLHFFASTRSLSAFPTEAEVIMNAGHSLDWLCKHPLSFERRYEEAAGHWTELGAHPKGFALRGTWPEGVKDLEIPEELVFVSCHPGRVPKGLAPFPVETKPDREAIRSGAGARRWTDSIKTHLRQVASVYKGATVCVRPQVLAKFDPYLAHVREIIEFASAIGLEVKTLRDLL